MCYRQESFDLYPLLQLRTFLLANRFFLGGKTQKCGHKS